MATFEEAFTCVSSMFNIPSLNRYQQKAISEFVKGGKDIFINLPTGFGKSLIYQGLPFVFDKVTGSPDHIVVVVSPLVNLMRDQVECLKKLGVHSRSLSDVKDEDTKDILKGKYPIVFGTPESWLKKEQWRHMLSNSVYNEKLCCIAVDEAHIIKQW